jgi:hypothetical protein
MDQDQSMQGSCNEMGDDAGPTPEQMAAAVEAMGVKLPTNQWERIPSLKLVDVSGQEFEAVKEHVKRRGESLQALLGGRPGELNRAIHEHGPPLRALLEKPHAEAGRADQAAPADAASGQTYTPEQKRAHFLWGTSHLLEVFGDALERGASSEDDLKAIRTGVQSVLDHSMRALSGEEPGQEAVPASDEPSEGLLTTSCSTCYPTFLNCTLPPATCQANYSYCSTHCTYP